MTLLTQLMAAERQRELMRVAAEHRRRAPGWFARRRRPVVSAPLPVGAHERAPDCSLAPRPTGS